jgi:O-antigen ligase
VEATDSGVSESKYVRQVWRRQLPPRELLFLLASLGVAAVAGFLASGYPLMALAVMVVPAVVLLILAWPNSATPLVLFVIYSNVAVVAVRFHGLPYLAGAVFPLLLLAPLTVYLVIRRQPIILTPLFPWIVAFVGIQLVGVIFARNIDIALTNVTNMVLEGILLYFLIVNVVRTPPMLRYAVWALLAAGVLLSIFPIYQQLTGTFDNNYWGFAQLSQTGFGIGEESLFGEVRQFRLAGAIGEQNRFGQVMLMLVPLGILTYWSERSRLLKVLALGAGMMALLAAGLTFSRGGAVGFALVLLAMVFLRIIRPRQFLLVILFAVLLLLALPQYSVRLATLPSAATLLSGDGGSTTEVDGAIRGRTTVMLAAILVTADHPIIGVGPGMFAYYSREYGNQLGIRILEGNREAHSLPLDIAANNGLLGFIAFFGMFYITFRELLRIRERWRETDPHFADLVTGILLAILTYLTTGLFLHLSYVRYLWLILALGGAAMMIGRGEWKPGDMFRR